MHLLDLHTQRYLKQKHFDNKEQGIKKPLLFAMAGIPAAGKTSYLKQDSIKPTLPNCHYYHNPDIIMEMIPGYIRDLKELGAEKAKINWESASRDFADNTLFPLALEKRCNILCDMGLARSEIINMLNESKKAGYQVHITMIYCKISQVLKRSQKRSYHVGTDIIKERAIFLAENFENIAQLAHNTTFLDNSGTKTPYRPVSMNEAKESFLSYKTQAELYF